LEIDGERQEETETVIIATGASAKWLGIEAEMKLMGHGVSACATCDGAFFKGKHVAVVGGGDTAMEEATFLTRYARRVTVIHRRDTLRACKVMQDRAMNNPKIDWIWNSTVSDIFTSTGKDVSGLELHNLQTQAKSRFDCEGLFLAIGHQPNTSVFAGKIELDPHGYVVVHKNTNTNIDGVFAAGDVADTRYRQAVTAAGMGCMAAMDAEKWLEARGH
jgi:thioredoxin reductase (NADPH)